MSDNFTAVDSIKFSSQIGITSPSQYLTKVFVQQSPIALSLEVSNRFLNELRLVQNETGFDHIDIVNTQLTGFQLKSNERLKSRLTQLCYRVGISLKKYKGGRQRQGFLVEKVEIAVYQNELFDVKELSQSLQNFSRENVDLLAKCTKLYESLQQAQGDCAEAEMNNNQLIINQAGLHKINKKIVSEIDQLKAEKDTIASNMEQLQANYENIKSENSKLNDYGKTVENENQQLLDYIQSIEKTLPKPSQKDSNLLPAYSMRSFKTEASKALWFAEAYGLLPKSLKCGTMAGKNVNVTLNSSYGNLDQDEKHYVKQLLYILDKFAISDSAYYELSMLSEDLPRKYLVVQERNNLNRLFHIERCPGNTPGAFIKIKDEIISFILSSDIDDSQLLKVKISGDGSSVSRVSNFVTLSLTFPDQGNSSPVHNVRTIGLFKCKETYEDLSRCCAPVCQELNQLLKDNEIIAGEKKYKCDIFLEAT